MPQNFPTNRQNPNRKDESIRRANRVIQTRTFVLMLIMGIGMFFLLFFKLYLILFQLFFCKSQLPVCIGLFCTKSCSLMPFF